MTTASKEGLDEKTFVKRVTDTIIAEYGRQPQHWHVWVGREEVGQEDRLDIWYNNGTYWSAKSDPAWGGFPDSGEDIEDIVLTPGFARDVLIDLLDMLTGADELWQLLHRSVYPTPHPGLLQLIEDVEATRVPVE